MENLIYWDKVSKIQELNLLQMTAVLANKRYGVKNIYIEAGRGVGTESLSLHHLK